VVLGVCPHVALRGQLPTKKAEPPLTPILPAEQAWAITLPFPPSANGALDAERAYIPLEGEHFIALKRESGDTAWTVDIESASPPLVHDGAVYLAASDELHALDAATGQHKWRVELIRGAMAPMIVVGDMLVVLAPPDEVWALRTSDGSRVWRRELGGRAAPTSMAVDSTGVYVAIDDRLVRLMLADGTVRWDKTLPGVLKNPALGRDRLFVGSDSNDFYAFRPERGELEWTWRFGGDVTGAAANDEFVVVAALDNLLRGLRRGSGNQVWKRALTMRPSEPPKIIGGVVALAGLTSLATFNAETGVAIGAYTAPADAELKGMPLIDAAPKPYAVSMIAITRDGRVMGLRPTEMMFRERAVEPLTALPGRPLQRETRLPDP
jgi:outer membrane protein assembly factor BamB